MKISYETNQEISKDAFISLLTASLVADSRPVDDLECNLGMMKNSHLIVSAWDGEKLIGIVR